MVELNNSHVRTTDKAGKPQGLPANRVPESLTPQEFRFMLVLQKLIESNPEVRPTFEDLKREAGLSSKSGVARLVDSLIEKGRIAKGPFKSRSLYVVAPVSEPGRGISCNDVEILKSFSDRELIMELVSRGYDFSKN